MSLRRSKATPAAIPAWGRVPVYPGCRDERHPGISSWESLEHIGPLTRHASDAALAVEQTALAQASPDSPAVLRERVTSKGGTTYAALTSLDASGVKAAFVKALKAAQRRANELGNEFG